jgi:hypothetical protein
LRFFQIKEASKVYNMDFEDFGIVGDKAEPLKIPVKKALTTLDQASKKHLGKWEQPSCIML